MFSNRSYKGFGFLVEVMPSALPKYKRKLAWGEGKKYKNNDVVHEQVLRNLKPLDEMLLKQPWKDKTMLIFLTFKNAMKVQCTTFGCSIIRHCV